MFVLTTGDSVAGREAYKSKNSLTVEKSRKAGLHDVGICTVPRSSLLSSTDVPMKSNVRQLSAGWKGKDLNTKVYVCHTEKYYKGHNTSSSSDMPYDHAYKSQ